ncbi:MAG: hypothetical protein ACE37F_04025 [Nannocystaceae bacterium]|nr:hypothetical protein [bacterium]
MNDQIRYYRFVAQFVDAVTTEPLVQALCTRNEPIRLRDHAPQRDTVMPPMPRAA